MCLPQGVEMSSEQMRFATDTITRMDPKVVEKMVEASGGLAGSSNSTVSPSPLGYGSPGFEQAAAALQVAFQEHSCMCISAIILSIDLRRCFEFEDVMVDMWDVHQANPQLMSHAMDMFGKMDPQVRAVTENVCNHMARFVAFMLFFYLLALRGNATALQHKALHMQCLAVQLLASISARVGESGQGGQPSAAAMADMLADPQSAKAMKEMISNLTPEQLISLSGAAGQQITSEQVFHFWQ